MSAPFNEIELTLIDAAKRTLRILAKVISDKDPKIVMKDEDLAALVGNKTVEEALADPELGDLIRKRLTSDLPQLNGEQEALTVAQLGPAIFSQLRAADANDNNHGPQ